MRNRLPYLRAVNCFTQPTASAVTPRRCIGAAIRKSAVVQLHAATLANRLQLQGSALARWDGEGGAGPGGGAELAANRLGARIGCNEFWRLNITYATLLVNLNPGQFNSRTLAVTQRLAKNLMRSL